MSRTPFEGYQGRQREDDACAGTADRTRTGPASGHRGERSGAGREGARRARMRGRGSCSSITPGTSSRAPRAVVAAAARDAACASAIRSAGGSSSPKARAGAAAVAAP